jgi:hypothetical protein
MDYSQRCQYNMDIDFKTATDILALPATVLAEAFGLQPQTIRQMRLSPEAVNYRSPPDGWQKVLARLAKERSRELKSLVDALERDLT